MAKALNFKTITKRYLTVTLNDEKGTTLMIGTPTKKVMDGLLVLQETFKGVEDGDEVAKSMMDDLYQACADIMSNNKTRSRVSVDMLSDIFDFEDIFLFFNAYMEFVEETVASKN